MPATIASTFAGAHENNKLPIKQKKARHMTSPALNQMRFEDTPNEIEFRKEREA